MPPRRSKRNAGSPARAPGVRKRSCPTHFSDFVTSDTQSPAVPSNTTGPSLPAATSVPRRPPATVTRRDLHATASAPVRPPASLPNSDVSPAGLSRTYADAVQSPPIQLPLPSTVRDAPPAVPGSAPSDQSGNAITKGPGFWNSTETPDSKYDNWVSLLLDDRSIADLSIPGTHQSVANAGLVWSWCQSLPLDAQLNLGIRFFDIHLRHIDNNLPVYHAKVYQNSNLSEVLKPLIEFLNVHTFEMVVLRIKEEVMTKQDDDYEKTYNRDVFCKAVNDEIQRFPKEKFWFSSDIPSLGDVRGKIVLIQDFYSDYPLGIPISNLKVSDDWNMELGEKKWEVVRKHVKEAIGGSQNEIYMTFTSARGGLASPGEIANVVNAKLHSFVCGKQGRFGIIAMDYPGPQLIRDIIDSNF